MLPRTNEQNNRYANPDNDPRGVWKPADFSVKTYSVAYDYPITTPSGRVVNPPTSRSWMTNKENYEKLIVDNRIWFGKDGNSTPALKKFLSEVKDGMTPLTIWTYKEVGHNQEGKKELKELFPFDENVFGTPKVVRLLMRLGLIGAKNDSTILGLA